jgi:hypothetical protein
LLILVTTIVSYSDMWKKSPFSGTVHWFFLTDTNLCNSLGAPMLSSEKSLFKDRLGYLSFLNPHKNTSIYLPLTSLLFLRAFTTN